MKVNERAPVLAAAEIPVEADRETVWAVIAGIDDWPSWNPDVKEAALYGELAPGARFRWKAGPGTVTSVLQHVDPPREMAWTGTTFGVKAVHVYRLEPRNGKTIARTEESWDGLLARLFRRSMRKALDKAVHDGLRHLKAEAERRSSG